MASLFFAISRVIRPVATLGEKKLTRNCWPTTPFGMWMMLSSRSQCLPFKPVVNILAFAGFLSFESGSTLIHYLSLARFLYWKLTLFTKFTFSLPAPFFLMINP